MSRVLGEAVLPTFHYRDKCTSLPHSQERWEAQKHTQRRTDRFQSRCVHSLQKDMFLCLVAIRASGYAYRPEGKLSLLNRIIVMSFLNIWSLLQFLLLLSLTRRSVCEGTGAVSSASMQHEMGRDTSVTWHIFTGCTATHSRRVCLWHCERMWISACLLLCESIRSFY